MTHNQQSIEQPERDRGHHEQVHRGNPIGMVTEERPPSLRRRPPPPHHISGHAGLTDIDAKLEELAMDSRCSIGDAHLADSRDVSRSRTQRSALGARCRSTPKRKAGHGDPEHTLIDTQLPSLRSRKPPGRHLALGAVGPSLPYWSASGRPSCLKSAMSRRGQMR
jgi:hypothetical protein